MWRWGAWFLVLIVVIAAGVTLVMSWWGQDWAVTVLAALGGLLTLGGLGWGVRQLATEYGGLVDDLDAVAAIHGRTDLSDDQKAALQAEVRPPSSSWLDVSYLKEWIRRLVLEHTVRSLQAPAALTTAGIVCGTAASVWSTWGT